MRRRARPTGKCDTRGISVAEAIITASMLSALTVAGIGVVCLLMTAEQRTAESVVVESTIAQLADDLRRDAHAALSVHIEDAAKLSFQLGDDSHVLYECVDDGVWRREQTPNQASRQERFHLPFGASRFETTDDERLVIWRHERELPTTLSFSEPSSETDQPRRRYRIEAALGVRSISLTHLSSLTD